MIKEVLDLLNKEAFENMQLEMKQTLSSKENKQNLFHVFPWEAGVGKSLYTNKFIVESYLESLSGEGNVPTYLIVKKFVDDIVETEGFLKKELSFIGSDRVIGITADNWEEYKKQSKKLNEALVIIITHERYIHFCNSGIPNEFRKQVLIIDEKVNFPVYVYNKSEYDSLRPLLKYSLQKRFDELNSDLLEQLEQLDNEGKNQLCVVKLSKDILLQIKQFKLCIDNAGVDVPEKINKFLGILPLFYNEEIIYNNSCFFAMDKTIRFEMLENNIMLDASANIDKSYDSSMFKIMNSTKLVDYKDATLVAEIRNSSKSRLKKYGKDEMLDLIRASVNIKEKKLDKRVLYVIHKDNLDNFKKAWKEHHQDLNNLHIANESDEDASNFQFAVNWFGNLVGKNSYGDYNYCHIGGTNNLPYPVYVLQYAFYNNIKSISTLNLNIIKGTFEDIALESYRKSYLAAEFYQSLKRVQRNLHPKAIFIIVNHDIDTIDMVSSQLSNVKYYELRGRMAPYELEKKTQSEAEKLIEYLSSLPKGKYSKKEICSAIGIKSKNFSRILKHSEINRMINNGLIIIKHHEIELV